jgi:hypothetical protein
MKEYLKGRTFNLYEKSVSMPKDEYRIVSHQLQSREVGKELTWDSFEGTVGDGVDEFEVCITRMLTFRVLDVLVCPVSVSITGDHLRSDTADSNVYLLAENIETGKLNKFELEEVRLHTL